MRIILSAIVLTGLLAVPPTFCARTPRLPAGYYVSDDFVSTIIGPLRDAIRYAPKPAVRPDLRRLRGRGVYVIDIAEDSGLVDDVRVLKSSGYTVLDEIAREALRQWRFRPRSIHKLTVPIEFGGRRS